MHDHVHHAPEALDYAGWVDYQRAGKDAFFRDSPNSPIPAEERAGFAGLSYYPVDMALRFDPISLTPLGPALAPQTQVQTSDGAIREGRRVGTFIFRVAGVRQRLTALQLVGAEGSALFVPFMDGTSGTETYAAGRYLDLEPSPDGAYELDFNLAYSPFCAYSPRYSCPLPPPENRLSVAIKAGERSD